MNYMDILGGALGETDPLLGSAGGIGGGIGYGLTNSGAGGGIGYGPVNSTTAEEVGDEITTGGGLDRVASAINNMGQDDPGLLSKAANMYLNYQTGGMAGMAGGMGGAPGLIGGLMGNR